MPSRSSRTKKIPLVKVSAEEAQQAPGFFAKSQIVLKKLDQILKKQHEKAMKAKKSAAARGRNPNVRRVMKKSHRVGIDVAEPAAI